jgi:5-methylcytosine-specific restriction endonuclease McrA
MKKYAETFYKSKAWQQCRDAYMRSVGGLCERCFAKGIVKAGEIVHHKKPITPANITDPNITLSFNNLQLVCRECHAEAHGARQTRYMIDEYGRVTPK